MTELESIQSLEEEIRALEEKLAVRKAEEETGREAHVPAREEKDIFRDVLKEHVESAKESSERRSVESSISSGSVSPPHDYAAQAKAKADNLREKEHREQVEALVEIALTKGVLEAAQVARHLGNPHLLDDFHDMLIDEYYEKLLLSRQIP